MCVTKYEENGRREVWTTSITSHVYQPVLGSAWSDGRVSLGVVVQYTQTSVLVNDIAFRQIKYDTWKPMVLWPKLVR